MFWKGEWNALQFQLLSIRLILISDIAENTGVGWMFNYDSCFLVVNVISIAI